MKEVLAGNLKPGDFIILYHFRPPHIYQVRCSGIFKSTMSGLPDYEAVFLTGVRLTPGWMMTDQSHIHSTSTVTQLTLNEVLLELLE